MKRTIIIECQSCLGTGLVKKEGQAACECSYCKGTGKTEFTYNEFEGRKEVEGITRVFPYCPALDNQFFYRDEDYKKRDGQILHFSQYGCTYKEWIKGKKPIPMEELYCPAEFYLGDTSNIKEKAPCSRCINGFQIGGCYCHYYGDKLKCWEEWNKNNC